jgi:hypothetical protein
MAVRGPYRIAVDAALFDAGSPSPLDGIVQTDHHWLAVWDESCDEQAEQATGKPPGGPFVAVQYAVVVGEMRDLVQPRRPQCGRDGAPTGDEDRSHHKHHHMLPSRRGEPAPEWLHPCGQPAQHVASSCVRHPSIPESMCRGETRQSPHSGESLRPSHWIQSRKIQLSPHRGAD